MINTCIRSHDNIGWDGWLAKWAMYMHALAIGGKGYSRGPLFLRAQAFEVGFRETFMI